MTNGEKKDDPIIVEALRLTESDPELRRELDGILNMKFAPRLEPHRMELVGKFVDGLKSKIAATLSRNARIIVKYDERGDRIP